MLNKNFYPTPRELIDKMLNGIDFDMVTSILEPSAGKGDIADFIKDKVKRSRGYYYIKESLDLDCIEIESELQATLKGKGYRVIHNDFLTYQTCKQYDLIVMNPPFDNGEKHLLKALEMQENGGGIVCLLNAETLKNPYSNTRKELATKLKKYGAEIEYIENAFANAERRTGVEVALVKVLIPKKEMNCRFFDELKNEEKHEAVYDTNCTELTRFAEENAYIESAVEQYNFEVKLGIKLINEYNAMKPYIKNKIEREETDNYGVEPILTLSLYREELTINGYVRKVRYKYWEALFNNPKFTQKLTSNLQSELYSKIREFCEYDFSVWNIMTLQEELLRNTIKGAEETILALFEEFSNKYHYYDEMSGNIHYYNGWKTNKAYKINKKVIIPMRDAFRTDWCTGRKTNPEYGYSVQHKFADIIRTFDYLDGGRTTDINIGAILSAAERIGQTKKIHLKYFNVTFYKKGTCHIEFLDDELLAKFNIFGSQRKGWLPPTYGKKHYKDMSVEEQEVINEFDGGENAYEEVMAKQDYYLTDNSKLLMIGN